MLRLTFGFMVGIFFAGFNLNWQVPTAIFATPLIYHEEMES